MNKIIMSILTVLGLSVACGAEVVDAVYFNPSRLGRFEYLKVSDKLTTSGGVTATNMTVQNKTGGTVTVNNTGTYYNITDSINALGNVSMGNTTFVVNNLEAKAGSTSTFNENSTIAMLLTASRIKASTLSAKTIKVAGGASKDFDNNSVTVTGLKIGNHIPVPTECTKGLEFVKRWDEKSGQMKQVLACLGETPEPAKDCSDEEYFNANKSTCCVGIPQSDGRCWKYQWTILERTTYNKNNCPGTFASTSCTKGGTTISGNVGYCNDSLLDYVCSDYYCVLNGNGYKQKKKCERVQDY